MSTQQIKLRGKAYYAKVFEDNRDMKGFNDSYVLCNGAYTIDLHVDDDNKKLLEATGSGKQPKRTEDGLWRVKFIRKHSDKFKFASGAPIVIKPDGTVWDFEHDGPIYNGSEVDIEISVYDTSYGNKGTRLNKVKVITPVEMDAMEEPSKEKEEIPF